MHLENQFPPNRSAKYVEENLIFCGQINVKILTKIQKVPNPKIINLVGFETSIPTLAALQRFIHMYNNKNPNSSISMRTCLRQLIGYSALGPQGSPREMCSCSVFMAWAPGPYTLHPTPYAQTGCLRLLLSKSFLVWDYLAEICSLGKVRCKYGSMLTYVYEMPPAFAVLFRNGLEVEVERGNLRWRLRQSKNYFRYQLRVLAWVQSLPV